MSARGTANALTRTTAIWRRCSSSPRSALAFLPATRRSDDILDRIPITQGQQNGILDQLGGTKPAETKPAVPDNGRSVCRCTAANAPAAQAPAAQTPAAPATGTAPAAQGSGSHHAGSPSGGPEQGSVAQ